ncbi:MAG: ZmpA/ZmpB/ZmpC family metallo-endopeptidase-related protein, partial [Nanoarchaeota archaeon]|nr:ZmpA/ZmpB/ZmpC family metallo-endopeptidase-related protein [Nanoarchaeota archaeon]
MIIIFNFNLLSIYSFQGGDGSSSNPYQISNCVELQNMSSNLTASYELVQDINCGTINFVPIGNVFPNNFRGDFNGNYFTIYDFYIDNISLNNTGLFGVTNLASIANVSFYNVSINGNDNIGVLAGSLDSSTISNVDVILGDVSGNDNVGALVGDLRYYSRIENSFSFADVNGGNNVGGLVGVGDVSSIYYSYSEADVTGSNNVGGLMGNMSHAKIYDSYSRSKVTGTTDVGGLFGVSGETRDISIIGENN